jgi:Ni/Co efflux regulator RcnB
MIFAAAMLLLPTFSLAQPGPRPDNGNRADNRSDNRPDNRAGRPGDNRPGRPDRPVTLPAPGGPGFRPPPPRPGPGMRPPSRPNRPQFSWRGRYFNPVRGSLFRYPSGFGYRRWSIGAFLPSLFLAAPYYYDDWRILGVDRPPPGRRWVRYGPDLLLVNLRTRRVEDVITDVFY